MSVPQCQASIVFNTIILFTFETIPLGYQREVYVFPCGPMGVGQLKKYYKQLIELKLATQV